MRELIDAYGLNVVQAYMAHIQVNPLIYGLPTALKISESIAYSLCSDEL